MQYKSLKVITLLLILFVPGQIMAEWTELPEMGSARFDGMAVADGESYLYVIGGTSDQQYLSSMEVFNGIKWNDLSDLPSPFAMGDAAYLDGKIYLPGGYNGTELINDILVYDIVSDSWTATKDELSVRYGYSLDLLDDILIRCGGADATDISMADCWEISPSVSPISSMNQARRQHASAVFDGKLFVFGGIDDGSPTPQHLTSAESYDPETDSWEDIADMPVTFWGGSSGVTDDGIWACHGIQNGEPSYDCHVYSPEGKGWQTKNAATFARYRVLSTSSPFTVLGGLEMTDQGAKTVALVKQWIPEIDDDDDDDNDDSADDDDTGDDDDNDDTDDDTSPGTSSDDDDDDEGCCG